MELYLQQEHQQRLRRERQIRRLSERLNRYSERDNRANRMNAEAFQRVKKKLIVFYVILLTVNAIVGTVTGLFWHKAPE